ncbi:MAG: Gfo/Idh/MocA family oxidoreductase [Verrucomicrobia bacterium]|nr:Gfo/Idh/MocA family oxidoreductase [Verrucomicrobiota bacterium]
MRKVKKHRLAIIGCGGMAEAHAQRFNRVLHRVEVVAAVDVIPDRARAVAGHFPGARAATDHRDVFDDCDAALLVLPHHLHHPIGLDFLAAGKHVLMEKPLANTEPQCLDLIRASIKARRTLMVAYCMRFHPLVLALKEALDSRAYGDLFQMSLWTEQFSKYDDASWVHHAATLGGGQLFSHGCHYIDLLLWFLGRPVEGAHIGTNLGTPWMEREGTSHVTIRFESGAVGYHAGTWGARGSRLGYSFHAHCTEAMIEARFASGRLYRHKGDKEEVLFATEGETHHMQKPTDNEMIHFLDCIESGKQPLTDPASSLQSLRVIWRLYEAEDRKTIAHLRGLGLDQVDENGMLKT